MSTYVFDTTHTNIGFVVRHAMITKVHGTTHLSTPTPKPPQPPLKSTRLTPRTKIGMPTYSAVISSTPKTSPP